MFRSDRPREEYTCRPEPVPEENDPLQRVSEGRKKTVPPSNRAEGEKNVSNERSSGEEKTVTLSS